MAEGKDQPSPWGQLRNQIYLGSEAFVAGMQRRLSPDKDLSEIPVAQRRPPAKPLNHFARTYRDRDEAIRKAFDSGGYGLKAIQACAGPRYVRLDFPVSLAPSVSAQPCGVRLRLHRPRPPCGPANTAGPQ